MATKLSGIVQQNKDIVAVMVAAALLLLVPLVATQLGDEVVWTLFDFAVAGTLLVGTGLVFVLVARRIQDPKRLTAFGVALAAAFLFVWVQLAVGIFGS